MITLTAFLIVLSCGWIGTFLNLRRMSLVGDAVSHSLLPGLVVAFWWWGRSQPFALLGAAFFTSLLLLASLAWMSRVTRVKSDAIQTLLYSAFFAAGIVLVSLGSSRVDLDAECVLFGELAFLPLRPWWEWAGLHAPQATWVLALVTLLTGILMSLFYKILFLTTFDESFAEVNGQSAKAVRFALLMWLSVVVSASFESVGAILVVGMLILPGATLLLVPWSLKRLLWIMPLYALLLSLGGVQVAYAFDASIGATLVTMAFLFFLICIGFKHWRRPGRALRPSNDQTLSIPQK